MNSEIATLEREVIPGLERSRVALEAILKATDREMAQGGHLVERLASTIESTAVGSVHNDDIAIARRVVDGVGSVSGTTATMDHAERAVLAIWEQIRVTVRDLQRRVDGELRQARQQLERLKSLERRG